MKQLEQDIQTGSIRPAYLVYGPEDFLRQKCKKLLIQALGGDSMNFTCREGEQADEEEVLLLAGTMPFMADRRLVLLENTGWTAGKKGKLLAEELDNLPDSTVLAFIEKEADPGNPLFQAMEKRGLCVACEAPSRGEAKNALRQSFEAQGYEVEGAALDLFYERCGGDLNTMEGEREKLMAFVLPERRIRREDVEVITHQGLNARVFDMINAMAQGRPREAFRLYEDLKAQREKPGRILSLIINQVGQLYAIRELDEKGLKQKDIEKAMGLKPYPVQVGIPRSRAFSSRLWKRKWERCLEYEFYSRSGKMDVEIALELALIEVSLR